MSWFHTDLSANSHESRWKPVKVVLTFESADENLRGDDPNETSPVAFSFIFLFSSILKNEICKLRKILTLIWPLV